MIKEYEFEERQHFRQNWLILFLMVINGLVIYFFISSVFLNESSPGNVIGLSFGFLIIILLDLLFIKGYLETKFDEDGINVKFVPFHSRWIHYSWSEIENAEVIKAKPIRDFGGWGIRYLLNGDKAFNVQGKWVLKLELKNGKTKYIGTQRPNEIKDVVAKFHSNAS